MIVTMNIAAYRVEIYSRFDTTYFVHPQGVSEGLRVSSRPSFKRGHYVLQKLGISRI